MKTLHPSIKINDSYQIDVGHGHTLYVEESGDPEGIPVLFVHGGPGAGVSSDDRRYFDPQQYRIILFDQRGCGQSLPHGSLEQNTTKDLISDMEIIRRQLKVDRWLLFGGSWGSTLSLLYALEHPDKVMGMILRGIFLLRQKDLDWFYGGGASHVFPDAWQAFEGHIHRSKRDNLIDAYYELLTGEDELAKMNAAKHWSEWEATCATLNPSKAVQSRFTNPRTALSLSRIETHYFKHHGFIEENFILKNAHKLEDIPGIIIHGRYDMVCPLDNAHALHQEWKRTELHIIRDAGHASCEPPITDALVNATHLMARYHD